MATDRQPVWWVLYILVPLMGGLLVLEHQASLSPTGHKFMQISIVVCIYGLAWLWLRANTLALLGAVYSPYEQASVAEANGAARSLRSHLTPRQAYVRKAIPRHTMQHAMAQAYRMEINKCSLN